MDPIFVIMKAVVAVVVDLGPLIYVLSLVAIAVFKSEAIENWQAVSNAKNLA